MPQTQSHEGTTILVVEDDNLVLMSTRMNLEALGYTVLTAEDGPQAIEVLNKAERIDVLLTDVVMPGSLGGRELVEEARKCHPGVRTVLFSGYQREDLIEFGKIDEDTPLLHKPFPPQTLERLLNDILRNPPPA